MTSLYRGRRHIFTDNSVATNITIAPGPDEKLELIGSINIVDTLNNPAALLINGTPITINTSISVSSFEDLSNVSTTVPVDNDVIYYTNGLYHKVQKNNFFRTTDLVDVNTDTAVSGDLLIYTNNNYTPIQKNQILSMNDLTDVWLVPFADKELLWYSNDQFVGRSYNQINAMEDLINVNTEFPVDNNILIYTNNEYRKILKNQLLRTTDLINIATTTPVNNDVLVYTNNQFVPKQLNEISSMEDLTNVSTTVPVNNDVLVYTNGLYRKFQKTNFMELNDLTDVVITNIQDNELLIYNGGVYENSDLSLGSNQLTDCNFASLQNGQFVKINGSEFSNAFITPSDVMEINSATNYDILFYTNGEIANSTTKDYFYGSGTVATGLMGNYVMYNAATGKYEGISPVIRSNQLTNYSDTLPSADFQIYMYTNGFMTPVQLRTTNMTNFYSKITMVTNGVLVPWTDSSNGKTLYVNTQFRFNFPDPIQDGEILWFTAGSFVATNELNLSGGVRVKDSLYTAALFSSLFTVNGLSTISWSSTGQLNFAQTPKFLIGLDSDTINVTGDGTVYNIPFDQVIYSNAPNTTGIITEAGRYCVGYNIGTSQITTAHISGAFNIKRNNGGTDFYIQTELCRPSNVANASSGGKYVWRGEIFMECNVNDTLGGQLYIGGGTKTVDLLGNFDTPRNTFFYYYKVP